MASVSLPSRLTSRVLDLLYPPRCLGCGAFGGYLCGPCLEATPRASPPRCPICWMPTPAGDPCRRCREAPPAFVAARCPFIHERAAREAVHALKYHGLSAAVPVLAGFMAEALRDSSIQADLIV
ncbi:MAG: double zinc ribbon domain-containing protein, partial [Dehalococcoidia bacterium]